MAQNSKSKTQGTAPKTARRQTYTLERAAMLCPDATLARNLATRFALNEVDFTLILGRTQDSLATIAAALSVNLNEQALEIHMQRVVGSFVASACAAGEFYSAKVTIAREMFTRLSNDSRDEDRDGVAGFENKAQRARAFAAQVGLQAYALYAAAQGAVSAFKMVTGSEWVPYQADSTNDKRVDRQAAQVEIDAFNR